MSLTNEDRHDGSRRGEKGHGTANHGDRLPKSLVETSVVRLTNGHTESPGTPYRIVEEVHATRHHPFAVLGLLECGESEPRAQKLGA